MSVSSWSNVLCFLPLLASGLLLPGWLLARLIPSPLPLAGAFLGSAVILFHAVLALEAAGIRLGAPSIACALAVVNLGLALLLWQRHRTAPRAMQPAAGATLPPSRDWPWIAAVVLGFAAIAVRATVEPLSGFDNVFRWDMLARQVLREGTLAFYPPVTAADFNLYAWCDGIPPLVPMLDLWSYGSAVSTKAVVTAPWILLSGFLLFQAVGRLAGGLFGPGAVWPSRAVLATSALALWSVAIGQETGLTALTLVAMLACLDAHRRAPAPGALFWAGVAAGAGGLCREYGLAWPILGLLTLAWHGQLRQGWKIFALTAVAIAAPWYLRNWAHTGNPLFAQELGGLFPGNAIHREFMATIGDLWSIGGHLAKVPRLLLVLTVLGGAAILLGAAGLRRAPRQAAPLVFAAFAVAAFWLWSIGQTAGGWDYSTRVLAPAIAILAVFGGAGLAAAGAARRWLAAAVLLLAGDAALRSLYLPTQPLVAPWKTPGTGWLAFGRLATSLQDSEFWKVIGLAAAGEGIVVDHPSTHASFAKLGAKPIPFFSPQLDAMYDERLPFPAILARLRAEHVRFVVVSRQNELFTRFMVHHTFLRELLQRPPVFDQFDIVIYDLSLLRP